MARVVLYDKIGPGSHPCNWCENLVEWMPGSPYAPGSLHVDHVDHDPTNDDPENLVPSCNRCNSHRRKTGGSRPIKDDEVWVVWSGSKTRAVSRECEWCGTGFLTIPAQVKIGKGRFCSRSCVMRNTMANRKKT